MTLKFLLALLWRRWYVVVVVLILTVGGVLAARQVAGVYSAQTELRLTVPTGDSYNSLNFGTYGLVPFAEAVVAEYNGSTEVAAFSLSSATLAGAGVRHGERVTMLNAGSQFAAYYPDSIIEIDVVDTDPKVVADRVDRTVAALTAIVDRREAAAGSPADLKAGIVVSPSSPNVAYVGPIEKRAMAGIVLLGALIAVALAVLVDGLLRRRADRRPRERASAAAWRLRGRRLS